MTSRTLAVRVIAGWEMRGAARTRWVVGAAVLYGAGAIALSLVGLRSLRELGLSGAGAVVDGLVALGVLFPPLIGLLLGAGSVAGSREQGTLPLMSTQPIRRSAIPWGMALGLTATVWAAVGIGLGLAAVVLAPVVSTADLPGLAMAAAVSLASAAVGVSLGVMISSWSATRSQATAVAAAVWFAAALGMDLLLAAVAPGVRLGPVGLLWAILLNPLEGIRLLATMVTDPAALGPFGVYMFDRLGRGVSMLLLGGAAAAWTVIPVVVASRILRRRDV
ncbi:MAG TPA: ABC transporter permease subunit [Acidimicrobiia bacterium]|nr:ABC transporter permease subunit [Acidimicrobiia bacterium]